VVDVGGAIRWVLDQPGTLVVEGVGGFEVPLDATHRVSDFARASRCRWSSSRATGSVR
jgi:dethiobiotin synthetase